MRHILSLLLTFCCIVLFAQDYYWVGGSGNWSDYANHWATTSGGSTFHTSVPTSSNDVYFDVNSFSSSGQIVTLDEEANCLSMDWSGVTNFPSITSDNIDLNIYGSLLLASDMTADLSDVEFESTTSGNTITSNGVDFGSGSTVRFNGIGGEWTLQDNLETNNLYVVAGTLTTNNHRIDAGARFNTSGSSSKVINLGSSEIIAERWWVQGTNQTINAGTSTIVVSSFYGDTNGDGPYNYYDVVFDNYGDLRNTASFNKITIPEGLSISLESGSTFTVNEIEAIGTKHSFIEVEAGTEGVAAIISQSSGSVDWSYVKLKDISATGGATFSANNSIDNGNNTGWTINEYAGQDYYWVGDGGNWSDYENHWATTSGGSTMHTDYPNSLDDVYFDENSFTIEGQTVIQDIEGGTSFGNMDWTGALNSPSLSSSYSFNLKAHGSVIFIDGMSRDLYGFDVLGNETGQLLDMSGSGSITFLSIQGEGEYDLLSDISVGVFTQRSGTVNYNGVSIDCSIDFDLGHNELVANFGSATITCRDFTHNSSSSTITGTPSLTVERNFEGNGVQFYEVTLSGSGNVLGSNTFEILQIQPGVNTILDAGETQTINQTLTLQGTKSSPISLSSDEAGTQSSISVSSGTIDAIYLTLKDINATGGATFNATQTLDNGNNTGWNITGLTALDYYWVGDGGSWSDFENHWATTSGGSTMHTDAPGVLDKVYFDANSFTLTDQTVTVDGGDISFHDMDWTGVTNNPSFDSDGNGLNVYGSMDFDPSVSIQLNDVYFVSTEAETITLQDDEPGTSAYFYFTGSGSWTFNSGFTVRELHQYSGDIDINGNKVLVDFRTDFFGEDAKTMTLGASDFFTRSLSIGSASNLTFDGSNSFISSSSSFSTLGGSDNTFSFNEFTFTRYNSTDEGILSADMTFNKLTFEANTDIELRAGITITTNELIAVGTADDPITIISQTEGTTATISQASGTVDAYYLELQDITATGGATFNAFSSIDNGNVSGWTFNRLSQTIDFTDIPDMPLDAPDFELEATATSGLPVSFEVISGNVELVGDGSTVSILGGGPVQIQARQAGNIDYDPAPSVVKSFTVTKLGQTIVFEELASKTVLDEDFELEATGGGSGNPVTFTSSNLDVATVTGSLVSIIGEGSTTITASQAGNDDYDAAADVEQVLTVTKPLQVIVFGEIPDRKLTDPDFELSATGGDSGNPVTFSSSDITIAEIDGNTVSILGAGTVTITASQAGNENYEPAEDVERTFTVYDPSQSIEFGELESVSYGDAAFNLTATASSELEVMYLSSDEDVAQVSGSLVTIVGVGTTTITAYQDGDEIFDPADEVTQDLVVNPAILSVTAEDKTKVYGDANPTLTVVYDGFVNNEDESVLNTEPTVNTEADATSVVGEYSITLQGGSADNYELERIEGVLEVTKRDLTAVADDQFMREGDFVPELTISYVGLVNNDSGSDIDIPPAISTTASSASPIGEYPITLAGGEDNNYLIVERIEGTLIVDKALGTDINELLEVSFYPNPVSGFLTVQSDGKMRNLEIRSLDGRLIGNYTINQNKKIDLRESSKGIYLLILKDGDVTIGTSRLIVE